MFIDLFNDSAATVEVTSNEDGSRMVRQKTGKEAVGFWDVITCQKRSKSSVKQILQTPVFTCPPLPHSKKGGGGAVTKLTLKLGFMYEGDPKKWIFFKKMIYLHFKQTTLNPLQNTLHWRQYTYPIFFPTV